MKRLILNSIELLGRISSLLGGGFLSRAWHSVSNHLYTGAVSHRFARWGRGSVIARRALVLHNVHNIAVGCNTSFGSMVQLYSASEERLSTPSIVIGDGCVIRDGAHITAAGRITIGNSLLTGTNVLITDNSHGNTTRADMQLPPLERAVVAKGDVTIGDNVWLGNNVCVMPGVTIGDGAVVGSNSVVTHDIPPYAVAVGAPARVVSQCLPG